MIDEAAAYGIVFEDVVSQSSWTKTSMASLWTGTHPIRNGVLRYSHVIPEAAVLPAEHLRDAGYRTVGLWRNGWVEANFGFAQGFESYVRPAIGRERIRIHRESRTPNPIAGTDEDLTISATGFLEKFGAQRFFLYLHYMDVHQYVYDESAAIFGTSYSDIYDQSIRWVDRLIGVLFDELERLDLLEAHDRRDRGRPRRGVPRARTRGARAGPARRGDARAADHPAAVPARSRASACRETVSNADIWPTLLDLLGLPPLPGADGRSLVPLVLAARRARPAPDAAPLERPVFAQLERGWGRPKRRTPASLVSVTRPQPAPDRDARERRAARALRPRRRSRPSSTTSPRSEPESAEAAARARGRLREGRARRPGASAPREVELDELRLNHLRALGYVVERARCADGRLRRYRATIAVLRLELRRARGGSRARARSAGRAARGRAGPRPPTCAGTSRRR